MRPRSPSRQFAICVDNSEYPVSLELHKVYRVIPDADAEKDGDVRIVDETGEDYLFPAEYFVLTTLSPRKAQALDSSFTQDLLAPTRAARAS